MLQQFNEYTEYVSRDSPSIHIAARLFEELSTTLRLIKERQGDWLKVSAAITVTVSDGISVLEEYYDYVKGNDIYYIAGVLDPRIKTRWLKTLPYGNEVINRIRAFLKRAYPSKIQPIRVWNTDSKKLSNRPKISLVRPISIDVSILRQ
jgi:hypothetical protein